MSGHAHVASVIAIRKCTIEILHEGGEGRLHWKCAMFVRLESVVRESARFP